MSSEWRKGLATVLIYSTIYADNTEITEIPFLYTCTVPPTSLFEKKIDAVIFGRQFSFRVIGVLIEQSGEFFELQCMSCVGILRQ